VIKIINIGFISFFESSFLLIYKRPSVALPIIIFIEKIIILFF